MHEKITRGDFLTGAKISRDTGAPGGQIIGYIGQIASRVLTHLNVIGQ